MPDFTVIKLGTDSVGREILMTRFYKDWFEGVVTRLGFRPNIIQGAFMSRVKGGGAKDSNGFHDEGGCIDLSVKNLSADKQLQVIGELRRSGAGAWVRDKAHGGFDPHIHVVLGTDSPLSAESKGQWEDYKKGLDGLASRGPDYHPRPNPLVIVPPTGVTMLHRVVGFNMHEAHDAKPVRKLITPLQRRWGQAPDVIALQEARFAHRGLKRMKRYDAVVAGDDGPASAELAVLVRKDCKVVSAEYQHAADGVGKTGPKHFPRGILTVIYEKDGQRAAIVNTHIGFDHAQNVAHVALLNDTVDALQKKKLPVFVTADANTAADRLDKALTKRGMRINRHNVDLIASSMPSAEAGSVARAVTGSDHDAVTLLAAR